jgi:hypothetical protein
MMEILGSLWENNYQKVVLYYLYVLSLNAF